MNLKELNNKEYLLALTNSEDFKAVIQQTHGFILYLMEKHNIVPEKNLMLENIGVFSLNFILKNYDLTDNEKKQFTKYFYRTERVVNKDAFTQEDFIEKMKKGESVPQNFVLDYDTLFKNQELMLEVEEHFIPHIIKRSTDNFTKEQVLSLDKLHNFYYYEVLNKKAFIQDKDYREFYINFLVAGNDTIGYECLRNLNFTAADKPLVQKIFARLPRYGEYSDLKAIAGLTDLITPIDYLKINSSDLSQVTVDKSSLAQIRSNFKLDSLLYTDSNDWEKLDVIVDNNIIEKLIDGNNLAKIYHNSVFSEDRKSKRQEFISKKILQYVMSRPEFFTKNNYYIQKLLSRLYSNVEEVSEASAEKVISEVSQLSLKLLSDKNLYLSLDKNQDYYNIYVYQKTLLESPDFKMPSIQKYYFLKLLLSASNKHGDNLSYQSRVLDNFYTLLDNYQKVLPEKQIKLVDAFFASEKLAQGDHLTQLNTNIDKINSELLHFILKSEQDVFKKLSGQPLSEAVLRCVIQATESDKKNELIEFLKSYESTWSFTPELLKIVVDSSVGESVVSTNKRDSELWNNFLGGVNELGEKEELQGIKSISIPYLEERLKEILASKNYDLFVKLKTKVPYSFRESHFLCPHIKSLNSQELLSMLDKTQLVKDFISLFSTSSFKDNALTLDLNKAECTELIEKIERADTYVDWDNIKSCIVEPANIKQAFVSALPKFIFSGCALDMEYSCDEIMQAYKNYTEKEGSAITQCSKYFINDMQATELEKLAQRSKEYPELYSLVLPEICLRLAQKTNGHGYSDERAHEYFMKFYDREVLSDALDILLQQKNKLSGALSNCQEEKNYNSDCIKSLIRATYYRKDDEYFSNLSQEDSISIAKKLFPHDIDLYLAFNTIGSLRKGSDNFAMLFSQSNTSIIEITNMSLEDIHEIYVKELVNLLINYYVKSRDELSLCYMKYMTEQTKFLEDMTPVARQETALLDERLIYDYIQEEQHLEILELFDSRFFLSASLIEAKVAKKKVSKL